MKESIEAFGENRAFELLDRREERRVRDAGFAFTQRLSLHASIHFRLEVVPMEARAGFACQRGDRGALFARAVRVVDDHAPSGAERILDLAREPLRLVPRAGEEIFAHEGVRRAPLRAREGALA